MKGQRGDLPVRFKNGTPGAGTQILKKNKKLRCNMTEVYTTKFCMENVNEKGLFIAFSKALRKQQQATLAAGTHETNANCRGVVQHPAARHSGG